jgi:gamma-glutamyl-gamma-aminobutyraldehyde dehydrogenase
MSDVELTHEQIRYIAGTVDRPAMAFIHGRKVPAKSALTFATVNPATGERLADIAARRRRLFPPKRRR